MIVVVTVKGQSFEVEVGDLRARPIVARIGAEEFEVWPGSTLELGGTQKPALPRPAPVQPSSPIPPDPHTSILAPLPGVITSIAVQPGATVTAGQELCVLEAMKMKNTIRAPRAGRIAAVQAAVGQPVKHREVLMEYAD
jgi:biotin carboxyl carrier protein